jgi:hypothetical protein
MDFIWKGGTSINSPQWTGVSEYNWNIESRLNEGTEWRECGSDKQRIAVWDEKA